MTGKAFMFLCAPAGRIKHRQNDWAARQLARPDCLLYLYSYGEDETAEHINSSIYIVNTV